MAARGLPPDRLPKGTRRDLQLLLRRVEELEAHQVHMPRSGAQALARVVAFIGVNALEGRSGPA